MESFSIGGVKDFNLEHIFECGQCFRWEKQEGGTYNGVAKGRIVNIRYDEDLPVPTDTAYLTSSKKVSESSVSAISPVDGTGRLTITPCTEKEFETIWRPYFDLDRDYGEIKKTLSDGDDIMKKATEYGYGIRLLKQDLWETIVSFIISQNNNIPRIKGCIERLCENFGEPITEGLVAPGQEDNPAGNRSIDQPADQLADQTQEDISAGSRSIDQLADNLAGLARNTRYDIPSPERLASLNEEDLAPVRLGYRAKYIVETARAVCEKGLPRSFDDLSGLCGVGPKVASCISLFGMQDYSSFPIDVWVMRVMHELYGLDEKDKKQMAKFARDTFGSLGGFAQQYLFYYMRDRS